MTDLSHRGGLPVAQIRPAQTLFERVGGKETIEGIIDGLYDRIESDALLRPMFLRSLEEERAKQKAFWAEWLGGEPAYTHHHAYSGLQHRHAHIYITREAADRWVGHLTESLEAAVSDAGLREAILSVVRPIASAMVNEKQRAASPKDLRCRRIRPFRELKTLAGKGNTAGLEAAIADEPRLLDDDVEMAEVMQAAAAKGRTETVASLIDAGVDPNRAAHWKEGCIIQALMLTPLCVALTKKRRETADLLRARGAIYDVFTAAFVGDFDGVRGFVEADRDLVNAEDPASDVLLATPLYHAVYGGHHEVVKWLLGQGAEVGRNSTALTKQAANTHDLALTRMLIDAGADATRVGPGPWVLHKEIADLLSANGADVNYPTGEWVWRSCTGNNSQRDNPALVSKLIDRGADVHTILRGATPLHYAAKAGFLETTKVLLERGADPNAKSVSGETPLFYAFKAGKRADVAAVCRLLVAAGADPLGGGGKGVTPLQAVARMRRDDKDEIKAALKSA